MDKIHPQSLIFVYSEWYSLKILTFHPFNEYVKNCIKYYLDRMWVKWMFVWTNSPSRCYRGGWTHYLKFDQHECVAQPCIVILFNSFFFFFPHIMNLNPIGVFLCMLYALVHIQIYVCFVLCLYLLCKVITFNILKLC